MASAKFQENRFRIDGEIAENHAILVNLTASYRCPLSISLSKKGSLHLFSRLSLCEGVTLKYYKLESKSSFIKSRDMA